MGVEIRVVPSSGSAQKIDGVADYVGRADVMDPSLRIVMRIPMNELWTADGNVTATNQRSLDGNEIASLLRRGTVRFVVADVGKLLRWIPPSDCYEFWKIEVKPRLVETPTFNLAEFSGVYCYVASEWGDGRSASIVLLEKHH